MQSQWRRHLAVALTCSAWPHDHRLVAAQRRRPGAARAAIVLVLDVSQSMASASVKPSRLDAAKDEAKQFVASLPAQYNVALVSLSGNPAARMPPTTDRGQVNRAIDALALQDSTAIGDAINVAMATLQSAPKAADGSIPPSHRAAERRPEHRRPLAPARGGRGRQGQGADLHHRVRHRERLRRPRRQTRRFRPTRRCCSGSRP